MSDTVYPEVKDLLPVIFGFCEEGYIGDGEPEYKHYFFKPVELEIWLLENDYMSINDDYYLLNLLYRYNHFRLLEKGYFFDRQEFPYNYFRPEFDYMSSSDIQENEYWHLCPEAIAYMEKFKILPQKD